MYAYQKLSKYSNKSQVLLLDTILLSGPSIGEHFVTPYLSPLSHTIDRFVKVF